MNSQQIETILRAYKPLKGIFKGVYASDKIPSPSAPPFCLVANTLRSGTAGEHWIACYCESKGTLEYFDSLAEEPNADLQEYMAHFSHVKKSNIALQSLLSDACGHFCIYFLAKRKKQPYKKIIADLHRLKIVAREHHVKQYVQKMATMTT